MGKGGVEDCNTVEYRNIRYQIGSINNGRSSSNDFKQFLSYEFQVSSEPFPGAKVCLGVENCARR